MRNTIKCSCEFCKISKRLRCIQKKLNKQDANFLEGFVCQYLNVAQENDYHNALLNGTWPQSKIIHKAFLKWQRKRGTM